MASINGLSLKNYKEVKVDFELYPNAEIEVIHSGDVYLGNAFLFHFADDLNGGSMMFSENGKKGNFDAFLPGYFRWKSALNTNRFIDYESFIYELIVLNQLEKSFKSNLRYGKDITCFATFVLNGYGVGFERYVQGNKNLTAKIKEELEEKAKQDYFSLGFNFSNEEPICFTKAYRSIEDFNIVIGDEKQGRLLCKQELEKKYGKKIVSKGEKTEESKKRSAESRFKVTSLETEPQAIVEDIKTGKRVKVPLFAIKEVVRVLETLFE